MNGGIDLLSSLTSMQMGKTKSGSSKQHDRQKVESASKVQQDFRALMQTHVAIRVATREVRKPPVVSVGVKGKKQNKDSKVKDANTLTLGAPIVVHESKQHLPTSPIVTGSRDLRVHEHKMQNGFLSDRYLSGESNAQGVSRQKNVTGGVRQESRVPVAQSHLARQQVKTPISYSRIVTSERHLTQLSLEMPSRSRLNGSRNTDRVLKSVLPQTQQMAYPISRAPVSLRLVQGTTIEKKMRLDAPVSHKHIEVIKRGAWGDKQKPSGETPRFVQARMASSIAKNHDVMGRHSSSSGREQKNGGTSIARAVQQDGAYQVGQLAPPSTTNSAAGLGQEPVFAQQIVYATTQWISRQIAQRNLLGRSTVVMTLVPAHLGKLHLSITASKNGVLQVSFTTSNGEAQSLIHDQMSTLLNQLQLQGFQSVAIDVRTDLGQQNQTSSQQTAPSYKTNSLGSNERAFNARTAVHFERVDQALLYDGFYAEA